MEEDTIIEKEYNVSCCKSYCTPRGRCYSCPEEVMDSDEELGIDPDQEL